MKLVYKFYKCFYGIDARHEVIQIAGKTESDCNQQARRLGWILNQGVMKCPKCSGKTPQVSSGS